MLQTGQQAPTFELPGAGGGRIDTHGLTEYTDNGWAVVVVFYPFDFHPTCTSQMCTLRDSEALSLLENTVVLGVSTDGAYSHRAFAEQHRIDFPLLSDSDGRVAEAYGVRADEMNDHRGVARSAVFVIDPDAPSSTRGKVRRRTTSRILRPSNTPCGVTAASANCQTGSRICETADNNDYLSVTQLPIRSRAFIW